MAKTAVPRRVETRDGLQNILQELARAPDPTQALLLETPADMLEMVQARTGLDEGTVLRYMEDMERGDIFPPLKGRGEMEVWKLHGYDGSHRREAMIRLAEARKEKAYVIIEIRLGTRRDALLDGIGSNGDHGLPLRNADKRKAVELLLNDLEWRGWANRKLARIARVSAPLVEEVRMEMEQKAAARGEALPEVRTRKCERNGKVYSCKVTAPGGKRPRAVDPEQEIGKLVDQLLEKAATLDDKARLRLAKRLQPLCADEPCA